MTKLSRTFNLLLLAWLGAFSLADIKGIPDLVLCIGKDGHIELETTLGQDCEGHEEEHTSLLLVAESESHCGDCSDIPLFSAASRSCSQKIGAGSGNITLFTARVSAFPASIIPASTGACRLSAPPASPPAMAAIRSVRLLV